MADALPLRSISVRRVLEITSSRSILSYINLYVGHLKTKLTTPFRLLARTTFRD